MKGFVSSILLLCAAAGVRAQNVAQEKLIQERIKNVHFRSVALEKEEAEQYSHKLFNAVRHVDVKEVQTLLEDGLRVASFINMLDKRGQTALVATIIQMHNHLKEIEIAHAPAVRKEKGLRRESPVFAAEIPAVQAAAQHYFSLLELLIRADIDPNIPDKKKITPLMYAIMYGFAPIAERLLAVPAINLDAQDADGDTALIKAVDTGQPDLVAALIKAHAALNLQNEAQNSALMLAVRNADQTPFMKSLKLLLAAQADPNTQDAYGYTPLMVAAEVGNETVAKLLLAAGADSAIKNNLDHHKTALDYARAEKHKNIVGMLEAAAAPIRPSSSPGAWRSPSALRREAELRAAQEKRAASTVTPPESPSSLNLSPAPLPSPSPENSPLRAQSLQRSTSNSPYRPTTPAIFEE